MIKSIDPKEKMMEDGKPVVFDSFYLRVSTMTAI